LEERLEVFSVFDSGWEGDFLEIGRVFTEPVGGLQRVDRTWSHGIRMHVDNGTFTNKPAYVLFERVEQFLR
jgi:hypothetical protein